MFLILKVKENFPTTYTQGILKDDAVKMLHSKCLQIWKTQQWPQDWKRSVLIPTPKKGNGKEHLPYSKTALISYASTVMLKILQARLQQYLNWGLPDVQAGFRKGRGTRHSCVSLHAGCVFSRVRLFETLWTVACLSPLSMGILQATIL